MERFINHDSLAVLKSDLINLIAGQSLCISGGDFKKLTGDEITEFANGGRFMMANLAESANCIIDTTDWHSDLHKKAGGGCVAPFARQSSGWKLKPLTP